VVTESLAPLGIRETGDSEVVPFSAGPCTGNSSNLMRLGGGGGRGLSTFGCDFGFVLAF